MNETPRNVVNEPHRAPAKATPEAPGGDYTSDQAIENAALAGAAAIQRLVAERNNLRTRLGVQERDMLALHAMNEDLRRRYLLIHQHYVELAKHIVGRLEQFDATIREVVQEAHTGPILREEVPAPGVVQRLAEQSVPHAAAKPNGFDEASA
jgi:uncharacterized membrane protein YccC